MKKATYLAKKNKFGYIFILPWLIGFMLFFLTPFFQTIFYSLKEAEIVNQKLQLGEISLNFYMKAFTENENFLSNLTSSVSAVIFDTPIILIFSLFAATLINQNFRGRWLARLIFFLPIIYGTGFLLSIQQSFSGDTTAAAAESIYMIKTSQLEEMLAKVINTFPYFEFIIGLVDRLFDIVTRSGVQILIFLSGLNTVSSSYYEASKIDGASGWDDFWMVTIPVISPFIFLNFIFTIVDSFTHSKNIMISMIYEQSVKYLNLSYGSAMAMVYFLVIIIVIGISGFLLGRKIFYTGGER